MYEKKVALNFIKCWVDVFQKQIYLTQNDSTSDIDNDSISRYHLDQLSSKSVLFKNKLNALLLESCDNVDIAINGTINQIVITKCKNITISLNHKFVPNIIAYNADGSIVDVQSPLWATLTNSNIIINTVPYNVVDTEQILHND